MGGPQAATVGETFSGLEERFRELLGQRQTQKRRGEPLNDGELDDIVQSIAAQQGISRQECLRNLLQGIIDEETAALS